MSRLPTDPEGFIRANTALEAPAMVPEFKLWLASEYVPIWQATEAWLEEQNVDPPYWAFCWPGGQAIARYLLDNPDQVRGKMKIEAVRAMPDVLFHALARPLPNAKWTPSAPPRGRPSEKTPSKVVSA